MALRSFVPGAWGRRHVPVRREGEYPVLALQQQMDRLFDDLFHGWFDLAPFGRGLEGLAGYAPKVDVTESDSQIEVTAELPGINEKNLEVTLTDDALVLKGEKRSEQEEEKRKDAYWSERCYGAFQRIVPLMCEVDQDKVEASFKKGVLTVKLPKTAEASQRAKRVAVKGE